MKFLVFALCACAITYQGVSAQLRASAVATAKVAKTVVNAPATAAKSVHNYVASEHSDFSAPIVKSEYDANEKGYTYSYETGNGISAVATGTLKKFDDHEAIAVEGSYQYNGEDGTPIVFSYVADENGYQPRSDVLPVGPPVPPIIARALEYIAAHPPVETVKSGKTSKN